MKYFDGRLARTLLLALGLALMQAPAQAEDYIYVARQGDTLISVAREWIVDGATWKAHRELAKHNGLKDADTIDMQARTHGLADHFEAIANSRRIEQFTEDFGQQSNIGGQRIAADSSRQATEVGLLPRGKRLAHTAAQIFCVGGQPVSNDRFGRPTPLGQLNFRIENARQAERVVGDSAIAGYLAGQGGVHGKLLLLRSTGKIA